MIWWILFGILLGAGILRITYLCGVNRVFNDQDKRSREAERKAIEENTLERTIRHYCDQRIRQFKIELLQTSNLKMKKGHLE